MRDDRVFVVATDDTYAPEHFFEHLQLPRVKVFVLPTPAGSGLSAPVHVVERLKDAFSNVKQRSQIQIGDEFWVFLDTDHHFRENNVAGTLAALQTARHVGFEIAVSNPCFEFWLLLHHADVPPGTVFSNCTKVDQKLREVLGQYDKTSIKTGQFPLANVPAAIQRARALETTPDAPGDHSPQTAGTRVYRLKERLLPQSK